MSSSTKVGETKNNLLILRSIEDKVLIELRDAELYLKVKKDRERLEAKLVSLMEAEEMPKKALIGHLIRSYSNKIGNKPFTDLITRSSKEEIEVLDAKLAQETLPLYRFQIALVSLVSLITFMPILSFIGVLPGWISLKVLGYILVGVFMISGPMLPGLYLLTTWEIYLASLGRSECNGIVGSSSYLCTRRYLKKQYGDNYFPHEILKIEIEKMRVKMLDCPKK